MFVRVCMLCEYVRMCLCVCACTYVLVHMYVYVWVVVSIVLCIVKPSLSSILRSILSTRYVPLFSLLCSIV